MTVFFDDISYTYPGSTAGLADVTLELASGELVAVIGASGSGKTTLLKLLAGFLIPDRGRCIVDGVEVTRLPPRERQLGVVFQSYALFPHMSAADNVAYPLKVRGMSVEERRRKALESLQAVGLGEFAGRAPTTLSGGQQQRVALARALVFEPKALLLDEPLSALDAALRVAMREEIVRVQRGAGITALHVTHDQEEALSIADRVAVMQQGRIVQVATPRELYDNPATSAVAGFVGQANLWEGRVVDARTVTVPFGPLVCDTDVPEAGTPVTVLVRPERVDVAPSSDAPNRFACAPSRDRFLGNMRRIDVEIAGTTVLCETSSRDVVTAVSIPPVAVQLLPAADSSVKLERGAEPS